jgi:hypothetical protein
MVFTSASAIPLDSGEYLLGTCSAFRGGNTTNGVLSLKHELAGPKPWRGDETQNVRAKRKSPTMVLLMRTIPAVGADGGGIDKIGRLIALSVISLH